VSGRNELRLVVTNGGDNMDYDHADWAAARVTCAPDGDPPEIVDTAPEAGATATPVNVRPSVVFSERMDAATLTTSTFTLLKQGSSSSVAATVAYDATNSIATLRPAASLDAGATYTATVRGGASGAKDATGNPIAADKAWTFTTTAPPSVDEPPPRIAAAGDIACDPAHPAFNGGLGTATACRQRATSDLLVGAGYASVLTLGDNQYEDGVLSAFQQSFDPSWGRVKNVMRPSVGNHEYNTAGASGYFAYFGPLAGDPAKGYYSFDVGSWHLIALNTNCAEVDCSAGSRQERWLRADLAAHPAQCTLAYSHHPRYSSGLHGDTPAISSLFAALYDGNADLFLSGHDHSYERLAPSNPFDNADAARGIRQFVVGTGGRDLRAFGTIDSESEVRSSAAFGVLEVTLRSGAYEWRFVPVAGQSFSDSGLTGCH
jgi:acid phosphatase type 7